MARVVFTSHLQRFVSCPEHHVDGATAGCALEKIFAANPRLRDYIVDDQRVLRKHVIMFIDGRRTRDLHHPLSAKSEIHVLQALSGG